MDDIDVEVSVRNYRCFSEAPVQFSLKNGIQSFVGVNNSGKSCLLKLFYEFRNIFLQLSNPNAITPLLNGQPCSFSLLPGTKDCNELLHDRNGDDLVIVLKTKERARSGLSVPQLEITLPRGTQNWTARFLVSGNPLGGELSLRDNIVLNNSFDGMANPVANVAPIFELGPILSNMLYLGPFRNSVNIGGENQYYDMLIGEPFIKNWHHLKTGTLKKQNEAIYALTEDIRRIFGFERLDINASAEGQDLQLMIDGKSYKQSGVGSGLIQFILVLANASIKKPSFILIDEPELNLHPSLQIDFLTTLASYADFGILFATHNLGLARAVSDRIYSVKRSKGTSGREVRDFTGTTDLAAFLGELGFNAYQDLGFRTILLVEGPTELTTVQQLLRLYKKEHEVVMLHLGGGTSINANCGAQLAEIKRISPQIFALVDSDRSSAGGDPPGRIRAFGEECVKAGINIHVLDRGATENYFPEHAIKTLGNQYRALGPYEKLKDVNQGWGKSQNWRIARHMRKTDLDGTDLGAFLEGL